MKRQIFIIIASLIISACGSSTPPSGDDDTDGNSSNNLVCTEIGCNDMLRVVLRPSGSEIPAGEYEVSLSIDGDVSSCNFEIPNDPSECGGGICASNATCIALVALGATSPEITFVFPGTPQDIEVNVERNGSSVASVVEKPIYDSFHPNGEDCPPTCERAELEVKI